MKADQQIHFDSFRLDLRNEELWDGERALALHPKAYAVLAYLVQQAGRRVTKEELLDHVWGERFVSDAVLKVAVREIRKALNDQVRSPRFIETVHRRGYRFIAELSWRSGVYRAPSHAGSMVGREQAVVRLRSWLNLALEGERQVVFITGEPGMGKTTLVDAFCGEAIEKSGCWLASGHCLEHFGAGEAYLPVLEALSRLCRPPRRDRVVGLLRQHAPTWLMQMPSLVRFEDRERLERETLGATPERMLREMAVAVEALTAEQPLVLVLEDLHWSDFATLDLVSLLARRPEPARLLVLATYRPADAKLAGHPLRNVRRELAARRQCHELRLDYLDKKYVAEYLWRRFPGDRRIPGLTRMIHQHTEGNPLFMINVLDYLTAEGHIVEKGGRWRLAGDVEDIELGVPEGIRHLVERQIERLGEKEQRILETASVVGAELSAAAVSDALGVELIEVEECCDRLADRHQFLVSAEARTLPDGRITARYAFIHSLYQQILYGRLPDARRRRLHLRIGEGAERAFGEGTKELAAELAVHFSAAGDVRRAISYLRRTAEIALLRFANREASSHLTEALGHLGRPPRLDNGQAKLYGELLKQRGRAYRAMGDMLGAATDFEALAHTERERGDVEGEVEALLFLVSALYWVRRERCSEVVARAAQRSLELTDRETQSHLRGYCAHWNLNLLGWRDEDAHAFRQALATVRKAGDPAILALHVVRDVYFRCWQSDYRGAGRVAEEGLKLTLEAGDAFDYLVCKFFWGWALLHGGEWGKLQPLLDRGIEMAERNGHAIWPLMYRIELAWLHEQAFCYDEALKLCAPAVERARQDPQRTGQLLFKSLLVQGFAYLRSGRPVEAWSSFQEMLQVIRERHVTMDSLLYLPLHQGLSRYWLERGNFTAARREAQRLCQLAEAPGERTYLALGRGMLLEIATAEEDWSAAEALLPVILAVEPEVSPFAAWRVHAAAARLHRLRDRPQEAASHADRAAGVLRALAGSLPKDDPLRRSLLDRAAAFSD